MSMTAVEKVLAAKSGKSAVRPGDVVFPDPDYVMIHDGVVMGARPPLTPPGSSLQSWFKRSDTCCRAQ